MLDYSDLTDEELATKIAAFRDAIEAVATNQVGVVAGEGRRIEYTSRNVDGAREIYRELLAEKRRRNPSTKRGGSIAVEIG